MTCPVDNAVLLAAGLSSRFAPLSLERPKPLLPVRGEVLLERQIRQLHEAGVREILVVTGYLAEQFSYLADRYGVTLVYNPDYAVRNNHSSLYAARHWLANSYVCPGDLYFEENPFEDRAEASYYAARYADGPTGEWCLSTDADDRITGVTVGGRDSWYMSGHAFWSESFSRTFCSILAREYDAPATRGKFWEDIFREHLAELPMFLRRYPEGSILEFDSLEELRAFDPAYRTDSGSRILRRVCQTLGCAESEITGIRPLAGGDGRPRGFSFDSRGVSYQYEYQTGRILRPDLTR